MTGAWLAGAASVSFPVPVGTPMAGYAARMGPATGAHDELTIGAWYLGCESARFVLVAADLAAVDAALVQDVAAATGLDPTDVVICASHTHSGPAGVITRMHPGDSDQSNPALRAVFVRQAAEAITRAHRVVEPIELVFGQAETSGLAANRNAADGPFDPRVSVLATRNERGHLSSIVVHFACHPTILSADNRLLSADFPGAIRRQLEQRLSGDGSAPVVLYANGAAGDVSTRFTRNGQDWDEVERVGAGLAEAAVSALASAQPVGGGIATARSTVTLEPRALDVANEDALSGMPTDDSMAERRKAETRAQGAMLLDRLANAGPGAIQRTFDLPAWKLGDVRLIAVPGELFASLGGRMMERAPGPTLVLGYANGYVGYLVDGAAEAAGTYEALASPFAPGSGDRVADAGSGVLTAW